MIDRRALIATGAAAAAAGGAAFAQSADNLVLTSVDVHPRDYPTVEAVKWMGDEIARETGGRITFRQYPSGQLGVETDTVALTSFRVLDFCRVNISAVNNAFPVTQAIALPYMFRDEGHMRRVVDGEIGRDVLAHFERRHLIGLCFYNSGSRNIYNARHPVNTPRDMHGLKVRVPRSDIFMQTLNAMGANATPIPLGEVFTGLQTHLIDAAENNWATFQSTRHFEAAHHWSETEHCYAPEVLLISKRRYDALSAADRDLIRAKALKSVPVMRALWDAKQATARQTVLDAGIQAIMVDRAPFMAAVEPMKRRYGADEVVGAYMRRIQDHA